MYVEHWKAKETSVHLVAGGAFAKGIEVARRSFFEEHKSVEESQVDGLKALMLHYGDFECPPDSAKSLTRTAGALEFYYENYPFGDDGTNPVTFANGARGIEFSFAEPLDFLHPVSGEPILYTGRADMVAEFAGGTYIFDEKTTSQLGASWARQWELRSQFTGYVWAAQRAGINSNGAVVRGVSILKTKYDTMQVITYRSPHEVERWERQVLADLKRMKQCWEEGFWDYNLDHACAEYGGCGLTNVCKSAEPERWLGVYFEQRVWDPLARKEMTVEEYQKSWGDIPA